MHAVLEIIKACCLKVLQRHESLNIGIYVKRGLLGGTVVKNPSANAGDPGSVPGWEDALEKEMATHSSILAWKIPQMEEPGRLQSMGSQRVGHD